MNGTNYYSETKNAYDQNASAYLAKTSFDFVPPPLKKFIDTLPKNSTIVDLGCGPGLVSKLFVDAGINYIGLDYSEKTIEVAKKINPGVRFQVKDFLNLDFESNSIDAYIAIASLYHLTKNDFVKVLHNLFRTLKVNGKLYLVMKKGNGEYLKRDIRYKKGNKFVTYYSKKELLRVLRSVGFRITDSIIVQKNQVRKDTKSNYENRSVVVITAIKP